MALRGVRGATTLGADDAVQMREAVVELLVEMLERNRLSTDDLVSVIFTATHDLTCAFPAAAARELDIADVPLICAQELQICGGMPRVVRVLLHAETDLPRKQISHVYLREAAALREDLVK